MSNQNNKAQTEYAEMQQAMLAGMLNCSLAGSNAWDRIPRKGEYPTVEELILWAAAETVRRMEQKTAG